MQKKEKLKYHVKQKILKEPIYNRQEDETDAAWQAFCVWRDTPEDERTNRAVSKKIGKSRALIERWIYMWSWRKRLTAWENEKLADEMDNIKAQHAKAVQQNITIARAFKNEVVKYIKWFNDNKTDMLADMNPKDVVWIFQTMTSLERQMNEDLIGNEKAAQTEKEQIIFTFER